MGVASMAKQATQNTLQARDGASIFYRHWPSTGPAALVVAHGNGSHSGPYVHLASQLVHADVYALDLRGYGASPVGPRELSSWQAWADDTATVAAKAAAGGKQVILFGHSLSAPSPSSKAITPEWVQGALGLLQAQGPLA